MNREEYVARIENLRAQQGEQKAHLALAQEQAEARKRNITLIDGAIQDCEFWVSQCEQKANVAQQVRQIEKQNEAHDSLEAIRKNIVTTPDAPRQKRKYVRRKLKAGAAQDNGVPVETASAR